jgi:hydrogenase nickel incorporation protein HypA/HybF
MHEMSLTVSIMEIIFEYARNNHFTKVNAVKLSFGTLSGIEPKALEFAFEVLSKDTLAHGAKLEYEREPIIITCLDCGMDSEVEEFPSLCPLCKAQDIVLKAGTQELRIVEMDVD